MGRPNDSMQLQRVFSILHLLKEGSIFSYEQLAQLLGVSETTAKRDVDMLEHCDLDGDILPFHTLDPEELPPRGGIAVWRNLPALENPLRLSSTESRALLGALDYAGFPQDDPLREKLTQAVASGEFDSKNMSLFLSAVTNSDIMRQLSLLCEQHRLARILYCPEGAIAAESRLVEPIQIVSSDKSIWYLEAFCHKADDYRTFRIDRIESVEEQAGHFTPHDNTTPMNILPPSDAPLTILRMPVDEPFEEREWPGSFLVSEEECMVENGVRRLKTIAVPYVGTEWIARRVVARLGRMMVVEPDEVRERVVELAQLIEAGMLSIEQQRGILPRKPRK